MKKFFEIIKNKWLIKGTTTLLLVAIVIACYVLINWGVTQVKVENIDVTTKKLYSLSDESKNKVKNIDKDVTIELINIFALGQIFKTPFTFSSYKSPYLTTRI